MAVVFKVVEDGKTQTFEGFRLARTDDGKFADILAIASFFGSTEIWALDGKCPIALDELQRYYRHMYDEEAKIVLYSRMV